MERYYNVTYIQLQIQLSQILSQYTVGKSKILLMKVIIWWQFLHIFFLEGT